MCNRFNSSMVSLGPRKVARGRVLFADQGLFYYTKKAPGAICIETINVFQERKTNLAIYCESKSYPLPLGASNQLGSSQSWQ